MSILDAIKTLLQQEGALSPEARRARLAGYLRAARSEVAAIAASAKRARAEAAQAASRAKEWRARAETALRAGREDLARQALLRAYRAERDARELERQATEAEGYVRELTAALRAVGVRVQGVAHRSVRIDGSPFAEFARIAQTLEVEELESDLGGESDAVAELDLAERIRELESEDRAREELRRLKERIEPDREEVPPAEREEDEEPPARSPDLKRDLEDELARIRRQLEED